VQIAIVKYGMGNVASVQKVLKKIGYNSIITDDHSEIEKADLILLPGVGSFKKGMENLIQSGLKEFLTKEVVGNKKPFIGICLGMQLVATKGTEPEEVDGLGWIEGEVIKFDTSAEFRVPHLGWNNVNIQNEKEPYSAFDQQDYYFIHSYHFKPKNNDEIAMTVDYDGEIVAALQKENINVMQFHPEKSQEAGMQLLQNIIAQYA